MFNFHAIVFFIATYCKQIAFLTLSCFLYAMLDFDNHHFNHVGVISHLFNSTS